MSHLLLILSGGQPLSPPPPPSPPTPTFEFIGYRTFRVSIPAPYSEFMAFNVYDATNAIAYSGVDMSFPTAKDFEYDTALNGSYTAAVIAVDEFGTPLPGAVESNRSNTLTVPDQGPEPGISYVSPSSVNITAPENAWTMRATIGSNTQGDFDLGVINPEGQVTATGLIPDLYYARLNNFNNASSSYGSGADSTRAYLTLYDAPTGLFIATGEVTEEGDPPGLSLNISWSAPSGGPGPPNYSVYLDGAFYSDSGGASFMTVSCLEGQEITVCSGLSDGPSLPSNSVFAFVP